ncbi:MAG: ABC transporter permease [candidate division WOR-3 bacterium]
MAMITDGIHNNKRRRITRTSEWRSFSRIFLQRKLVLVGLIILILLFATAIFADKIAPYDPYEPAVGPPLTHPCKKHLLGTDLLGRDVFSRLIYGSRVTLLVGFATVTIASIVGIGIGLIAGYFGGIIYTVIMRMIDALMSFPMILIAILISALLGSGVKNVIIALSIALLIPYTRVTCGLTLSIKENDYILAQKAMGSSHFRILFFHILPNAFPPLIVLITLQLGVVILTEAGLSFLGLGIKPPMPAWGAMVSEGYKYLRTQPMLSLAPGLAVMLVAFSFNVVGDGLRDALDPRLRGLL